MAARIRKGTKTVPMPDSWREKIQLTKIMARVQDGFFGNVELTPEQINCAKLILSKVVPDLARTETKNEHTGNVGVAVINLGDDPTMIDKLNLLYNSKNSDKT
jgi:hypothetical protein